MIIILNNEWLGPLSVCLDASSWNSYTGGVMSTCGKYNIIIMYY